MRPINITGLFIAFMCIFVFSVNAQDIDTLINEGFENGGARPTGWTESYLTGTADWSYAAGGYSNNPATSYEGSYNASFEVQSFGNEETFLLTPELDFTTYTDSAVLEFYHAQVNWGGSIDTLGVYYKTSAGGAWVYVESYSTAVTSWTKREITLPNINGTYYVAFKGYTAYGYGTLVDNVIIKGYKFNDLTSQLSNPTTQVTGATVSSLLDTDGEAFEVIKFNASDAGTLDGLETKITQVTLKPGSSNTADWTNNIGGVKLHNGTRFVGASNTSITDTAIVITLNKDSLKVADGASIDDIAVHMYFTSAGLVEDGNVLDFRIDFDDHDFLSHGTGSSIISTLTIGSDIEGNSFAIDVIPTKLAFGASAPPGDVQLNTNFNVTVNATDANNNVAASETGAITVAKATGSGTFSSVTGLTQNLASGTYAWTDAQYNTEEIFTITATHASLTAVTSGNIHCLDGTLVTVGVSGDVATLSTAYGTTIPADITGLGKYYIKILDDYDPLGETIPLLFPAKTGNSSTEYVTIFPDENCTAKTLTHATNNTVDCSGTDYLVFDGRPSMTGSTSVIKFENTSTSSSDHALRFSGSATNNTFKYIDIEGSNSSTSSSGGVVSFASSGTNTNNKLLYCTVGDNAAGLPAIGINGQDATGDNSGTEIRFCDISDFTQDGIVMDDGADGWSITDNSMFHTVNLNTAAGNALTASYRFISSDETGGHIIRRNYFGGMEDSCGGAQLEVETSEQFYGVYFQTLTAGAANIISSNTFTNFHITSTHSGGTPFIAVTVDGAMQYNVDSNVIGATSGVDKIQITDNGTGERKLTLIYCSGTGRVIARNNSVGGISINDGTNSTTDQEITIFKLDGAEGYFLMQNNTIGNSTADNMKLDENVEFNGVWVNGDMDSIIFTGNVFQNFDHNSTGTDNGWRGYYNSDGHTSRRYQKIQGNTMQIINTTANSPHYGIYSATGVGLACSEFPVDSNLIDSFIMSATGTSARFAGIYIDDDASGFQVSPLSVTENTVQRITYAGSYTTNPIWGISIQQDVSSPGLGTSVVTHNTVKDFACTNTGAVNVNMKGMNIDFHHTDSYLVDRNLVQDIENAASGASARLTGIHLNAGSDKGSGVLTFRNNSVVISNGSNTNNIKVYGVDDGSASRRNIYHNTISIQGTNGGAADSYAFSKWYDSDNAAAGNLIKNNVFQSKRTGGTGDYYAIYFDNATDYTIDYNFLETATTNIAYHGGGGDIVDLPAWKTITSQAANSIAGNITLASNGRPTSSSLIGNAGEDLSVTNDLLGFVRDATPWIGAFERDTALAISLIRFIGELNDGQVDLEWLTATEENSDYFEILKSIDGKTYASIGQVDAAGNSIIVQAYSFIDYEVTKGMSYYKFKSIDLDGSFGYSPVVTIVNNDPSASKVGISVYPNPISDDQLNLLIDGCSEAVNLEIIIMNIEGKIVYASNGNVLNGESISLESLSKGMYFLSVTIEGELFNSKIIKE